MSDLEELLRGLVKQSENATEQFETILEMLAIHEERIRRLEKENES